MSASEADNPQTPSADIESPGVLLKRAREQLNLTPEAISTRLRLSKKVIKHIENDEYDNLPAPIFVKGYLKSYANMVDLPTETVINSYRNFVEATDTDISLDTAHLNPVAKRRRPVAGLLSVLVLITAVVAAGYWYAVQPPGETVSESGSAADPASSGLTFEEASPSSAVGPEPMSQATEAAEVKDIQAEPVTADDNEPPAATSVQSAAVEDNEQTETPPASIPVKNELVLEFNADSWVDISDAQGQRLVYRMVKAGDRRVVSGTPPFKLTLGNAPEIDLYNNGVKVDLIPYTRGKVAKFRLGDIDDQ